MTDKTDYIAVFDSGIGGISVLRQLQKAMPQERFYYFGDSANAPYGDRSEEEILDLTFKAVAHLLQKPVKALVLACNTATAVAVEQLRQRYSQLMVVGIEPAVKLAADHYPGKTVGMLSTRATLRNPRVVRLMEQHGTRCRFVPLAAPELVPLIEGGLENSDQMQAALDRLLGPHRQQLDALVLGCTHYPFAAEAISRYLGPHVPLLDGSIGTATHTKHLLEQAGLLHDGPGELLLENSSDDPVILERCRRLLAQL